MNQSMLCGFDDNLAVQTTQTSNRIRGLLTQRHPAPERVLGQRQDHPAGFELLQRYPSPEKTIVVPGTNAAVVVLPRLTLQLITLCKQRE